MAKSVLDFIIRTLKQGNGDRETISGLQQIQGGLLTAGIAVGAFTAAWFATDRALNATVGAFVTLTGTVRAFRDQTGMTAEDTGRLVEVVKDLDVSQESLVTAFKFAEKNGFEPTLKNILALQQEYLGLSAGQERVAFLQAQFGKGGLAIQKLFETGDLAERLQAVSDAMLPSEADLIQAQKYKDQMHDIDNAWMDLKLNAGKIVLPIEIKFVTGAGNIANDIANGGDKFNEFNKVVLETSKNYDEYKKRISEFYNDPSVKLAMDFSWGGNSASIAAFKVTKDNFAQFQAAAVMAAAANAGVTSDRIQAGWENQNQIVTATSAALVDYSGKFDFMLTAAKNYQDIATQTSAVEVELAAARKTGYAETGEKITGLKDQLVELKKKSQDMANQMVLDLYKTKISADGVVTEQEITSYFDLAVGLGLMTRGAADMAIAGWDAANATAAVAAAAALIPDHATKTMDYYINYHGNPGSVGAAPVTHTPGSINMPGHYDAGLGTWVPTTYWAHGGPVGAGQMGIWNENPATRPEVFVGPPGGGFIMTKQDAQERLGGDNGAVLAAINALPDKLANKLAPKIAQVVMDGIRDILQYNRSIG